MRQHRLHGDRPSGALLVDSHQQHRGLAACPTRPKLVRRTKPLRVCNLAFTDPLPLVGSIWLAQPGANLRGRSNTYLIFLRMGRLPLAGRPSPALSALSSLSTTATLGECVPRSSRSSVCTRTPARRASSACDQPSARRERIKSRASKIRCLPHCRWDHRARRSPAAIQYYALTGPVGLIAAGEQRRPHRHRCKNNRDADERAEFHCCIPPPSPTTRLRPSGLRSQIKGAWAEMQETATGRGRIPNAYAPAAGTGREPDCPCRCNFASYRCRCSKPAGSLRGVPTFPCG